MTQPADIIKSTLNDDTPIFKIGDVVTLKSGGPKMTVETVYTMFNKISCVWFEEAKLNAATFEKGQIKKSE